MSARRIVREAIEDALKQMNLATPAKLLIEEPKNPEHGDLSTNAAMLLAREAKKPPRAVAEELAALLQKSPHIENASLAGPGFCNFRLKPEIWQEVVGEIEKAGNAYGNSTVGAGKRAQVEYVSANPTGPLHIGHGRGAAVGDSVARILRAAGYDVATEYYLNDAGRQMRLLGKSIWLRLLQAAGKNVELCEDCYKGEYIRELAADLLRKRPEIAEMEEKEALEICEEYGGTVLLDDIRGDLARFGCEHQRYFSEKSLVENGAVAHAFEELENSGKAYEKDGAFWFASSEMGDDGDRVLRKSDGSLTYFATDIAYHKDKFNRGFDWLIDVWGADHHGYVPRMKAAVASMGNDSENFDVLLIQLVNLRENGKAVSMSTRAGEFITLKQLLDEVGVDAARFLFLSRSCDSPLDFDLAAARARSMENPVYYAQYAHARVRSLLRRGAERGYALAENTEPEILALLTEPEEIAILRLLDAWEGVVENSAASLAPHYISNYASALAERIHGYYSRHNILGQEDENLVKARMALLRAAAQTLRNALFLLGVSAPEAM